MKTNRKSELTSKTIDFQKRFLYTVNWKTFFSFHNVYIIILANNFEIYINFGVKGTLNLPKI